MKKIAQIAAMSLMLTAIFGSINTPAIAGVNGPIGISPAPMPTCDPADPRCTPIWPRATVKISPAPMPTCDPADPRCTPIWPR